MKTFDFFKKQIRLYGLLILTAPLFALSAESSSTQNTDINKEAGLILFKLAQGDNRRCQINIDITELSKMWFESNGFTIESAELGLTQVDYKLDFVVKGEVEDSIIVNLAATKESLVLALKNGVVLTDLKTDTNRSINNKLEELQKLESARSRFYQNAVDRRCFKK